MCVCACDTQLIGTSDGTSGHGFCLSMPPSSPLCIIHRTCQSNSGALESDPVTRKSFGCLVYYKVTEVNKVEVVKGKSDRNTMNVK